MSLPIRDRAPTTSAARTRKAKPAPPATAPPAEPPAKIAKTAGAAAGAVCAPPGEVGGGDDDNPAKPRYYLGVDCATKTLGFSFMELHADRYAARRPVLERRIAQLTDQVRDAAARPKGDGGPALATLAREIDELDREIKTFLVLLDGGVVDLFPGRPDKSIHTVERLRALQAYMVKRVVPVIVEKGGGEFNHNNHNNHNVDVVIEFQEGANAKTRTIGSAVAMLFIGLGYPRVYFVGPSLKNKLGLSEAGKYYNFAEKYAKNYDANKAHAKFNFALLESFFGTRIPPTHPPALRGHIADACMQCLGHLAYGHTEDPESHF